MPAMRIRLDDLPPTYRAQAERQLHVSTPSPAAQPTPAKPATCERRPNLNEAAFRRLHIPTDATHVRYEAISLRVTGTHRYTPDWTWYDAVGRLHADEVKGPFPLPSQRSARLAYDQARIDYPEISFRWATQQDDHTYRIEA